MKTINGGEKARSGYYWNLKTWEVHTQSAEGALPGTAAEKFYRVPTPALFVLAPVMGGLFAVFLPFIGFAMTFYVAGKKVNEVLGRRAVKATH